MTSKQTKASQLWEANLNKVAKIEGMLAQARDYTFPAGQAQIALQLATVEVPFLLGYIEELKKELHERHQAAA